MKIAASFILFFSACGPFCPTRQDPTYSSNSSLANGWSWIDDDHSGADLRVDWRRLTTTRQQPGSRRL